jgi:hypothetical protein
MSALGDSVGTTVQDNKLSLLVGISCGIGTVLVVVALAFALAA